MGKNTEYNATEKVLQDVKDTWGNKRTLVCAKLLFLCLTQVLLICFLTLEVLNDDEMFKQANPSPIIVTTRFLCAAFLHVQLAGEIKQGFNLMKFANNHYWLFRYWGTAFVIGFLQAMVVVMTEFVNLAVLINNNTVQDIIMNFLALVVISEFDNFFLSTEMDAFIAKALEAGSFKRTLSGEDV